MIEKSVGSEMFQTLWADVDGVRTDILDGGDVSCAYFVSCLLKIFDLIESPHATVQGVERDLRASGWQETDTMVPGCILVWEMQAQADDEPHEHIGFYIGENRAVSNSYTKRHPVLHHFTSGVGDDGQPIRAIRTIYAHPEFLND